MTVTVFPPPPPENWIATSAISTAAWKWCHRIYLALSRVLDAVPPSGAVIGYAGSTSPDGWLLCDGSAVSRTTYADLYTSIGTTFGIGDGSTTFNLPDTRGRTGIGAGTGSGLSARTLGTSLGEETHVLTTSEMPSHSHTVSASANSLTISGAAGADTTKAAAGDGSSSGTYTPSISTTTGTSGSGSAHNNMQPSIVFNYIIKT